MTISCDFVTTFVLSELLFFKKLFLKKLFIYLFLSEGEGGYNVSDASSYSCGRPLRYQLC